MTEVQRRAEAFARSRHEGQFRKGEAREPYTVHLEEVVELVKKYGGTETEICAAWLHDTVEDCPPTSFGDIEQQFGDAVASIVRELTDDKSLEKAERKRMQVINATHKSQSACLIKICDKTSNLRSIANSPPATWSYERRTEYIRWAYEVVSSLSHKPANAIEGFMMAADQAEIRSAADCLPVRQAQNVALSVLQRKAYRSGASPEEVNKFLVRFAMGALEDQDSAESEASKLSAVKCSENVKFFDVEGIPVTLGAVEGLPTMYCAAWDGPEPRRFPSDSALRNGAPIDKEKFEQLRAAQKSSS